MVLEANILITFLLASILGLDRTSGRFVQELIPQELPAREIPWPVGGPPTDSEAPTCRKDEPCGWYKRSDQSKMPQKWLPSWCQCPDSLLCIFDRSDEERKVYIFSCLKPSDNKSILWSRSSPIKTYDDNTF